MLDDKNLCNVRVKCGIKKTPDAIIIAFVKIIDASGVYILDIFI